MRQDRTDRRSLRTRELLMQALLELMRTKRFEKITVAEIAEQANVGRSTFYAHFEDKDDLIVDGVRTMIADLDTDEPTAAARGTRIYPTLALFQHLGLHADLYSTMARSRALNLFLNALHDELTAVLVGRLAMRVIPGETPAVPLRMLASMIVGMLINSIRSWVEDGAREPAEVIDGLFHTVAGPAIRAGLKPVPR